MTTAEAFKEFKYDMMRPTCRFFISALNLTLDATLKGTMPLWFEMRFSLQIMSRAGGRNGEQSLLLCGTTALLKVSSSTSVRAFAITKRMMMND